MVKIFNVDCCDRCPLQDNNTRELRAALEDMVDELTYFLGTDESAENVSIKKARAAISKARGEQ